MPWQYCQSNVLPCLLSDLERIECAIQLGSDHHSNNALNLLFEAGWDYTSGLIPVLKTPEVKEKSSLLI